MNARQVDDVSRLQRELLSAETNVSLRLAPDGQSVAFIRTVADGPELWLRSADGRTRRLATHHGETLGDLRWSMDGSILFYRHTLRGRENWTLAGLRTADLGRISFRTAGPVTEYWLSQTDPTAVAFTSRLPPARYGDLYRVSGTAGQPSAERIAENPGFHRWLVDGDLRPRGGTRVGADGSVEILVGATVESARNRLTIETDQTADLAIAEFSRDRRKLFILTSHDAKTRRLVSLDSETGALDVVFEHPDLDVETYPIAGDGVQFDPQTGNPDICTVIGQRLQHHALTARLREVLEPFAAEAEHTKVILGRSADDRSWLIAHVHDDAPMQYRLFEPATGQSRLLFLNRPGLAGRALPKLADFCFAAGDGCEISGYAMRPLHNQPPFPTVVLVHGGPAGRDYWRFHADAQYLAALGYQSLHINYRGSRGLGTDFRLAGNGEWGGRMQQDLYDAVASGVAGGLVDPGRVAFFGASYGGYAALLAACTRPEIVRCAVAISAPCDLVSFTKSPPPYWQPLAVLLRRQVLVRRDGRELDAATLEQVSPARALSPACAPVLLAHGVRDPRVPVRDVDEFAARAQAAAVPVRYLRFRDEGHHVRSNSNRETLFAEIEDFLEMHLGSH
jgi:dipeptidyl aminopeptidase/acylaminoacyl peptidase